MKKSFEEQKGGDAGSSGHRAAVEAAAEDRKQQSPDQIAPRQANRDAKVGEYGAVAAVANPKKVPEEGELESLPSNTSEHDKISPAQRKNPNLSVLEQLIQNREIKPPSSMSTMNAVAKQKSWIICDDKNQKEF